MKGWGHKVLQRMDGTGQMRDKTKVNIFYTDNRGEYTSKDFKMYLQNQGITHQVTTPYTSAQNGKAEWLHWTFFNRAWAIMSENNFPPRLWGECILTMAYLKDRTPMCTLKDKTPYEAYYGIQPDVSHPWEIGCWAFILKQAEQHSKIYNRLISRRNTGGLLTKFQGLLLLLPQDWLNHSHMQCGIHWIKGWPPTYILTRGEIGQSRRWQKSQWYTRETGNWATSGKWDKLWSMGKWSQQSKWNSKHGPSHMQIE